MYSRLVNFNAATERWATAHDRPIVGNADVHRLEQLGSTYSLVESEPSPEAICEAIRQGRVVVRSIPLPLTRAAWIFAKIVPAGIRGASSALLLVLGREGARLFHTGMVGRPAPETQQGRVVLVRGRIVARGRGGSRRTK